MMNKIEQLRFWCQKVLPLVYDDSLSYYEVLCKMSETINNIISNINEIPEYIRELLSEEELKVILRELLDTLQAQIASENDGESTTTTKDRKTGEFVWLKGELYKVIRDMFNGDRYVVGSNIEHITIESELKMLSNDISAVENEIGSIKEQITEILASSDTVIHYNNVASLRNSTSLKDGDVVLTLGYYNINDGGKGLYKIRTKTNEDVETYDKLIIGDFVAELMYNTYINILQLGAKNDNSTDISDIIEYAFTKGIIYIPNGTYKVSRSIKFNKQPKIVANNATLNGNTDDNIFEITNTVDSRLGYIKGLNFHQNGNGHCVVFNGRAISTIEFEIANCQMLTKYDGSGGWCIYADKDLSTSHIHDSNFAGNGLYMDCFDANRIDNCLFYGGDSSTGIEYNISSDGVENNTVEFCVLVNGGCDLKISNGEHIVVRNNQFENLSTAPVGSPSSLIYIEGSENKYSHHIIIESNNIGGNANIQYGINMLYAKKVIIDNNIFAEPITADIFLNGYSSGNYIGAHNESRDINSSGQHQRLSIVDNGTGNMGVFRKIELTVGGTATYYKDEYGRVQFVPGIYTSTLQKDSVICTLPVGFRPGDICYMLGGTANEPLTFKVSFDGTITCITEVTSQADVSIGAFQAIKYQ